MIKIDLVRLLNKTLDFFERQTFLSSRIINYDKYNDLLLELYCYQLKDQRNLYFEKIPPTKNITFYFDRETLLEDMDPIKLELLDFLDANGVVNNKRYKVFPFKTGIFYFKEISYEEAKNIDKYELSITEIYSI